MQHDSDGYGDNRDRRSGDSYQDRGGYDRRDSNRDGGNGRERDEVYSKRVPAGKRTYFFDVKTTRSGEDYFLTITESKRSHDGRYEKHKIFLYKEDFGKFLNAMHQVIGHVRDEYLPDYEFRSMPELTIVEEEEDERSYEDEG